MGVEPVSQQVLIYLNRLLDLLFVLGPGLQRRREGGCALGAGLQGQSK